VSLSRRCSRTACSKAAIATLTYVYGDQTAVVGPLATFAEPHTYDLCADHAEGLTVPRGWDVVRLPGEYVEPEPSHDDLLALANAVREAGRPRLGERAPAAAVPGAPAPSKHSVRPREESSGAVETARRGHLRVLRDG
jgi:hypothetical protein